MHCALQCFPDMLNERLVQYRRARFYLIREVPVFRAQYMFYCALIRIYHILNLMRSNYFKLGCSAWLVPSFFISILPQTFNLAKFNDALIILIERIFFCTAIWIDACENYASQKWCGPKCCNSFWCDLKCTNFNWYIDTIQSIQNHSTKLQNFNPSINPRSCKT